MATQNKPKLHLKALLTLALVILACSTTYAEIYKVVDENGRITFTDKPGASQEAKTVELQPLNTQPTQSVQNRSFNKKTEKPKAPPTSITITSPADGTAIPTGQQIVIVNATVKPYLAGGQRIQFYFDGAPKGPPQAGGHLTLAELYRGQHTIQAAIVDKHGKSVSRSPSITIHVQRHSVGR